ncbi:MAG: TauD/TfdA family dioxygenase [Sphingomonadales bacterium]|nr:TauD/TfdA family dioxygenase [Sphingomonadales bacterium]
MTVIETQSRLRYETIKPNIGARILNTKAELLSGDLAADIRELIENRGVLVFPQVHFTSEEQVAFTKTLGQFMPEGGEDTYNISLDPAMGAHRDYLKGSLFWHADGTMNPLPIGYAVLTSRILPTWGGNTEFCNTYAAYDALSDVLKAKLEGLRVEHAAWRSLFYYDPEPAQEVLEGMMGIGTKNLPIVWTHRSGRKSLVLGCTADHMVGMDWVESARTLHGLRNFATSEPFHYAHEWSVGDAVMWDNSGTMHRAAPYDPNCGRLLVRTKTGGEEPIQ